MSGRGEGSQLLTASSVAQSDLFLFPPQGTCLAPATTKVPFVIINAKATRVCKLKVKIADKVHGASIVTPQWDDGLGKKLTAAVDGVRSIMLGINAEENLFLSRSPDDP